MERRISLAIGIVAVALGGLPACHRERPAGPAQSSPPGTASATGLDRTITMDTPWFDNPAQGYPPNGTIKAGTRCTVVSDAGSYVRIRTSDGLVGYVSVDSIAR
jgi:hypothetical protein